LKPGPVSGILLAMKALWISSIVFAMAAGSGYPEGEALALSNHPPSLLLHGKYSF